MKGNILILSAVLLAGCTAPMKVNTHDAEPRMVIYAAIDDSVHFQRVYLSVSGPYFENSGVNNPLPGDGAVVQISGSDGSLHLFSQMAEGVGTYVSDVAFGATAGVTYTLSVDALFNGAQESYTAVSTTLQPVAMDSIWVRSYKIMGLKHYITLFAMTDPPETNYYLLYLYKNGVLCNGRISQIYVSRDNIFNGQHYSAPLPFGVYESKESAEAMNDRFNREDMVILEPGDTLLLQTGNIERGYCEFLEQCQQSRRGSNPMFGGPPSNIITNISNEAVGYFATYCLTGVSTIVEE